MGQTKQVADLMHNCVACLLEPGLPIRIFPLFSIFFVSLERDNTCEACWVGKTIDIWLFFQDLLIIA